MTKRLLIITTVLACSNLQDSSKRETHFAKKKLLSNNLQELYFAEIHSNKWRKINLFTREWTTGEAENIITTG